MHWVNGLGGKMVTEIISDKEIGPLVHSPGR